MRMLIFLVLTALAAVPALSIPQLTLFSGNRCVNCHVNQQGAGLRNELGWYSMNETSLIPPSSVGLGGFYESLPQSNLALDERLNLGFDLRFQTARGIDTGATRKVFPMQVAAHAAYTPLDGLTLEGTYNAGPTRYAGQRSGSFSALVQPEVMWPQLRVGFFQPSIGIRYDDHSMMIRQIADNTAYANPLIAPNYAEWGAELTWFGAQWLTIGVGAFGSSGLAEVQLNNRSIVANNQPLALARIVISDHAGIASWLNLYGGASFFGNADTRMVNAFAGLGWEDRVSLMAEVMQGAFQQGSTQNWSVALSAMVVQGLMLEARVEEARYRSEDPITYENRVRQLVFGAQIFLLPYIELRPDYRIIDTEQSPRMVDQYAAKRWNVQLHFFF